MGKPVASILAIDDDVAILRNYAVFLEDCGFDVTTADSGRRGLELFAQHRHDAVLVDLRMPEVDGLTVLRSITGRTDTPVIVISGTGEIGDAVEALRLGAWDFLQKPIEDLSVLQHAIDKVLERARLIRQNRVYQQQLERLVEERTEALRSTNEELRASREELRSIADNFRLLTENQRDVVVAISPDGRVTYCSPAIIDLGGHQPDELEGHSIEQFFVSADDVERALKLIRKARSSRRSESMDLLFKAKDGRRIPVEICGKPVVDGDRVTAIQCVMRDVSERVRVEAERKRLATAVKHAAEEIIVTDRNGTIEYVNPAFEQISGFSRDEVVGKPPRILTADERDPVQLEQLWETLRRGEVWTGRFTNKRKDGLLIQEAATISPIRDDAGAPVGFVAVQRDITEEVKLREQLIRAQKMEAIGTLAGGIAHDFNNILSAILGYTELAFHSTDESSPLRSHLSQVLMAGDRARRLVSQILAFSRHSEHEQLPVQVSLVVKEVMQLLRASLPSTLTIQQRVTAKTEMVMGDPTQIHQVLLNLCTNAAHAMRVGEGKLEVSLVAEPASPAATADSQSRPQQNLRLTVRDTGHGIEPELLERIFEPYFTTKEPGEGTGLGLAVVHGIVKSHGGEIVVDSTVGEGTSFHVLLPVVSGEAEKPIGSEPSPLPGKEQILLVDDEEVLVKMFSKWLKRLGYEVTATTKSREALRWFKADSKRFDLVITDQTMPGMTGIELIRSLREECPDLPVILCTGFSEAVSPDTVDQLGNVKYLSKPISIRSLANEVRALLD
jgi:PAS domain S-box-containing protein